MRQNNCAHIKKKKKKIKTLKACPSAALERRTASNQAEKMQQFQKKAYRRKHHFLFLFFFLIKLEKLNIKHYWLKPDTTTLQKRPRLSSCSKATEGQENLSKGAYWPGPLKFKQITEFSYSNTLSYTDCLQGPHPCLCTLWWSYSIYVRLIVMLAPFQV